MILKIIQTGDPVLRKKASELNLEQLKSPATQQLIDLMIATLRDRPGVGLAAPQVGESLQIIVVEDKKKYHEKVSEELLDAQSRKPVSLKVIINPILQIENDTDSELFFEGCLSVDGYAAIVPRAKKVSISGVDRQGKKISFTAEGWFARILQHEVDHLNGSLYIDKMLPRTFITDKHYADKWLKSDPLELKKYINESQKF